ncbi:MAG: DUF3808 domain-containing protein [Bacteroidetes bacterium]|nr:MAG: DUF3808 domain-containing protein [Bacteroidota bacterium]
MKKKIITGLFLIGLTSTSVAQKAKVTSTYNYLKYGEIDKAKEAIDAAAQHPSTQAMAKTWFYRGQVYQQIYASQDPKIKSLAENALEEAIKSYTEALKYDTRKIDVNQLNQNLSKLAYASFDEGVNAYNQKNYSEAAKYFEQAYNVNQKFGVTDSLALYNAALAYEKAGDAEKAEKLYRKTIEIGYGGAKPYIDLMEMYMAAGKEDEAVAILKEARAKYPKDGMLLTQETNIYLKAGKKEEALKNLNEAIAADPNNPTFYFARGAIYNELGELDKAIEDYKKAIELDEKYFDAYYNLGALYFNQAAEYFNKIQTITDNTKYQEEKKKADEMFQKALPYLEKAHELNPSDKPTMQSLKQLYVRTGNMEKYNEMKEKLQN